MDSSKTVTWRSSVKPKVLRSTLLKGSLLAGSGALMLLLAGTFFPLSQLKIWGLPILIASLIFITLGLLPYRRLTQLETSPDELQLDEKALTLFRKKKPLLQLPLSLIAHVHYLENSSTYGLCIHLKSASQEKIKLFEKALEKGTFVREGCDVFFPYFSERSSQELNEHLSQIT